MLEAIYTGYPRARLRGEHLPDRLIRPYPYFQTAYMAGHRFGLSGKAWAKQLAWWSCVSLDAHIARTLPEGGGSGCDALVALSGCGLKSGLKVRERGGVYVCDRGSSHIRYQNTLMQEEYRRHGLDSAAVATDPRMIEREEAEYAEADVIAVPSTFALRSFVERGVLEEKLRRIPYGVDLSRFYPDGAPAPERFDVLFVGSASLRKGIPYLLEAFARLKRPGKRLTIVGQAQDEVKPMIARYAAKEEIVCAGHLPQPRVREMMSRHHVMVLPSIEEGLALVQAQALACGCPVIATTNTGAEDLFDDGAEGFIVPIRDPEALAERMQRLADCPDERQLMSEAALLRVQSIGGWDRYGDIFAAMLEEQTARKSGSNTLAAAAARA